MNYKIIFPADYKNVIPVRDTAYHVAKLQGFSEQKAERIRTVVDELCNNAIEYGSQSTSEVTLEIFADQSAIRIACHDQGNGNKLKAEQVKASLNHEVPQGAGRGRGIKMIVKNFTDELEFSDRPEGGLTVTAVIKNT